MKFVILQVFCFLVLGNLVTAGVEYETDGKQSLNEAVADLRATNTEWLRNDADYREKRQQGEMSDTDIREYAEFVAGLKRQVFEGCQVVRELGGDPGRQGVDCKVVEGQSAKHASISMKTAKGPTREEREQLLRSELKKLEAEFDGMILIQQEKIHRKASNLPAGARSRAGTGSDEESGDASGSVALAGGSETGSQADSMEGHGEPGTSPGVKKQDKLPAQQLPVGVGDGSDDDVVARQLREAAEAETDPALRVQLWNEYKKYKNSIK